MMPELTVETILLKWKNYWMERCRNAETKLRLLELEAKLGPRDNVPEAGSLHLGEWRMGDTVELKPSPLPQRFAVGKVGDTVTTTLNGPTIGDPPKPAASPLREAATYLGFDASSFHDKSHLSIACGCGKQFDGWDLATVKGDYKRHQRTCWQAIAINWLTVDTRAKVAHVTPEGLARWTTDPSEVVINRGRPAFAVCRCGHWEIDHQEAAKGGRCQVCPNCTYEFYTFRRALLGKDVGTQVCGTCHQQFKTWVELPPPVFCSQRCRRAALLGGTSPAKNDTPQPGQSPRCEYCHWHYPKGRDKTEGPFFEP